MNTRKKIILLGFMIWVITFMSGFLTFVVFGAEADSLGTWNWISAIKEFSITIGLALGLYLLFRQKDQDFKANGRFAGVAWYTTLLLMDLIVLGGLMGLGIALWYPAVLTYSTVAIIPILVGALLASQKDNH